MRGYELLDRMELISPRFIEEAEKAPSSKAVYVRWVSLAACLCIITAGALLLQKHFAKAPEPDIPIGERLPDENFDPNADTMGFEGYSLYDISEFTSGNPWSEYTLPSTLPIYRNNAYDDTRAGIPKGSSENEMQERLEQIIGAASLTVIKSEFVYDDSAKALGHTAATKLVAECDKATVEIFADGRVFYEPHSGGKFMPLEHYIDVYGELLGFKTPVAVKYGDYFYNGEFYERHIVYDAGSTVEEGILGYSLRYASFHSNENGELYFISMFDGLSVAEKTGDVRVINADEAKQRLINGDYVTSASYAFTGEKYIGKVELVYRSGPFEEMLLPYYRFYVQIPQDSDKAAKLGLKCYGAYYVSAIADEDLGGLPLYDGYFN